MNSASSRLLEGRIAMVTGGGSGIGAGIAKGLAEHGARVIVAGRTLSKLEMTVEAIRNAGGTAWAYSLDVANALDCRKVSLRISQEVGDVSILVNNAGVIRYADIDTPEVDSAWDEIINTNLSGPFHMARAFLDPLKVTQGAIVNVASIAGFVYTSNTVGYSASKGGVRLLTVALARELGPHGIRVNAIAPGAINTPMSPSAGDEKKMAALARRVPLGRIGEPEARPGPVVFLASSMSAYVTGTTLVADGGYLTS